MRRALALLFAITLAGCPYMTEDQYDSYWDNDQDEWGVNQDCDDTNPNRHPFAHDFRGDGCDADCGGEEDADNDDWPDVCSPRGRPPSPSSNRIAWPVGVATRLDSSRVSWDTVARAPVPMAAWPPWSSSGA